MSLLALYSTLLFACACTVGFGIVAFLARTTTFKDTKRTRTIDVGETRTEMHPDAGLYSMTNPTYEVYVTHKFVEEEYIVPAAEVKSEFLVASGALVFLVSAVVAILYAYFAWPQK